MSGARRYHLKYPDFPGARKCLVEFPFQTALENHKASLKIEEWPFEPIDLSSIVRIRIWELDHSFNPSLPQQLLKLPLSPALGGVLQNNLAGDGEGRSKAWQKASLPAWHQKHGFV